MGVLGSVGPQAYTDNVQPNTGLRLGKQGQVITSPVHGSYYEQSSRQNLFMCHAIITAPVIYTTNTGTGGPLLWNGSTTVNASLVAVGFGVSVVTTVAAALGLTGGTGQSAAPASTTAIDSVKNCYLGAALPACTAYRIGTPTTAGGFFLPFGQLHTGALTVDTTGFNWFDVSGLITVPPGGWVSVAASATASTTVMNVAMVWEEVAAV